MPTTAAQQTDRFGELYEALHAMGHIGRLATNPTRVVSMESTPRLSDMLRPPRLGPGANELSERGREILDQLEIIIVDEGFASLTVARIAARLRCSRSTLYELAPTKDELVLVVVDRRLRRIGRMKSQRMNELADHAAKIKMVISGEFLELRQTNTRFLEDVARTPAVQRLISNHFRYGVALLREVIDEGVVVGRFRPLHSLIVAEVIDAALARIQRPDLLRDTGLSFDRATVELMDLLCAGLVLDPPKPARRSTRQH
jgi:AcrR family transcriptional regulator